MIDIVTNSMNGKNKIQKPGKNLIISRGPALRYTPHCVRGAATIGARISTAYFHSDIYKRNFLININFYNPETSNL